MPSPHVSDNIQRQCDTDVRNQLSKKATTWSTLKLSINGHKKQMSKTNGMKS